MLIETKVAPETVSAAVPLTDPDVAVIVAVPVPTPDTSPVEFTVATDAGAELQLSDCSSCVLPSSKLPTAVNGNVVPAAMVCTDGFTAMETRCAATTVKVVLSVKPPVLAVIVV